MRRRGGELLSLSYFLHSTLSKPAPPSHIAGFQGSTSNFSTIPLILEKFEQMKLKWSSSKDLKGSPQVSTSLSSSVDTAAADADAAETKVVQKGLQNESEPTIVCASPNAMEHQKLASAMEHQNFAHLNENPTRIMFSHGDPSIQRSGFANVFIKNIATSIDNKALHDAFAAFGTVHLVIDSYGQPKVYGFIQFDSDESAQIAIKQLKDMLRNDKRNYVELFDQRQERAQLPKFTKVYVKNFSETITDEDLKKLFSTYGTITSVVVMKDVNGNSRCFGFVNFVNSDSAADAVEGLNGTMTEDGKVLFVGRAQRKAERAAELKVKYEQEKIRKKYANLYLKNLADSINDETVKELFSELGYAQSKGYGFIQFDSDESAQNAIKLLNDMLINDKQVYVEVFDRRQEMTQSNGSPKFTKVYVSNFSVTYTDEDLKKLFSTYGTITSVVVMKDRNGNSRCFGFVNFENADSAVAAVEGLNGTTAEDDKVLFVGWAQRKTKRETELKDKLKMWKRSCNLYLKNLGDSINDETLKELFSEFGTVTFCKVVEHGHRKGCGFVVFCTPEEARKALNEMNGKMLGLKQPLYVAVAQRKERKAMRIEMRKARLQFSRIQAPAGIAPMPAGIPEDQMK